MKKTILDDGSYPYLVEGAQLVGDCGIPELMDLRNTQIPSCIVPFTKAKNRSLKIRRGYVHFYEHDKYFSDILTSTKRYLDVLKMYDGVITPDCSMIRGRARCVQQINTYFNRAVGFYLQKNGIPVIPNIRWSDENSFDFCFLGVPLHTIVSISTHGCIRSRKEQDIFILGLNMMLEVLKPSSVIVHGHMPPYIFDRFKDKGPFYRFPSQFELTHTKEASWAQE